ncbi:MAG: stage III sporulation protein AF [Defluviitaleaceae bacterium]|nr:stage III sporulation protein AF [Defluviitaleaceae bacterium]
MTALSDYIRNLAVFLIFASFITIINPGKKFENYINLVLGIILIFIVIAPLSGVIAALGSSSGDIFADINLAYDRAALSHQIAAADQSGQDAILALFTEGLTDQTRRLVDNHGHFDLLSVHFNIDQTPENFGAIETMHLFLEPRGAARPLVRIDPVRITPAIGTRGEPQPQSDTPVENPHIMSLKNILSSFYNLDEDNIILETRD